MEDRAVSSVVGTVLMLGITVTVFAALSVGILAYFAAQPTEPRSELAAVRDTGSLLLLNEGGEPVPLADARVLVNLGGAESSIALSSLPGAAALGTHLDLGESVCIQGADPTRCLYSPSQDVRGATVVTGHFLLLQVGPRGTGASNATVPSVKPDLVPAAPTLDPATPGATESVTFSVVVTNTGGVPVDSVPILVTFIVDGATVGSTTTDGPLAVGASFTTTSPVWLAFAGTRTVTAFVDQVDAIAEFDESNNAASRTFTVTAGIADPGFPFEDVDGDRLYTAGTDASLPTADVQDGSHQAAAGRGLVVPASVGAIARPSISFQADGDITLGVSLTASSGGINLDTAGTVHLASGTTLSSAGALALDPGRLLANGTTFTSPAAIQLVPTGTSGTVLALAGATVDNTAGTAGVTLHGEGDQDYTRATVRSKGAIDLGGDNSAHAAGSVRLLGTTLDNTLGTAGITVHDSVGPLTGNATTRLLTKGALQVASTGLVTLTGATLDNSGGSGALTLASSAGAIDAAGARLASKGTVSVTARTTLTLDGATVGNALGGGTLTLRATTGALRCPACTVASTGVMTVEAGGAVSLAGASLTNTVGNTDLDVTAGGDLDASASTMSVRRDIVLTVPNSGGFRVNVQGAAFDDSNDKAEVNPNNSATYVTGTPASGGTE